MRIGLVLAGGREAEMARVAEQHGLFGVLVGDAEPRTAITAAVYASTATEFVRIATRVELGIEHPVTIAEELAVLDNINNGRTVIVADAGRLDTGDASDELAVLREALGNRPLRHDGPRWRVPAGLPANATSPPAIAVTPKPAQLEIPCWVTGRNAAELALGAQLPALATEPPAEVGPGGVQPGVVTITGELATDLDLVNSWQASGVTHLMVELDQGADEAALMTLVSRHLAPEVGMPYFPRVMSRSRVPLPWPKNPA